MKKMFVLIVYLMNFFGLNPLKKRTLLNCYIRRFLVLTSLTYGSCTTILFVYYSPEVDFLHNFIVALPSASFIITCLIVHIFMYVNESSINYVLSSMINYVFTYPDEDDFVIEYNGYLSEKKSTKIFLLTLLYYLAAALFYDVPLLVNYFLFGTSHFEIYPQWVPWTLESTLDKTLAFIIQLPVLFWVTILLLSIHLYYTFVMVELLRQYKKLKYAIETLSERSHKKVLSMKTGDNCTQKMVRKYREEYDDAFRYNIVMCIRHHQALIRLFRNFEILYNFEYSLQLIQSLSALTCALLVFVHENDLQLYLQTTVLILTLVSGFFFKCFVGEQFSEMNLEIQNTLFYDLNWYDQSIKNKKLILIFHCGASKSYTLRGFRIFPASYYTFSRLIRSSYSYFNVLRVST